MKTTQVDSPLTAERIRGLLMTHPRSHLSPDHIRLMEIYCVVKAGGKAAQTAVAEGLQKQETAVLRAEIQSLSIQPNAESRIQALQQEIQELETAMADRLEYLATITAEEEAAVRHCLPDIEAALQAPGAER